MNWKTYTASLAAALAMGSSAWAQPAPSNDNCANALPVFNHTVTPFDTTGATLDGTSNCIFSPATRHNIWYVYMAARAEEVTVSLCGSPDGNRGVSAFWGCGGPELACNKNSTCGTGMPSITFITPGAGPVLLSVTTRSGAETGMLNVDAAPVAGPANDTCATAQVLSGLGSYPFDSRAAATDGPSSLCVAGGVADGHDLYFSYTAGNEGYITVDTLESDNSTFPNSTLQVLDGCSGTVLACNDDAAPYFTSPSSMATTTFSKTCPLAVTNGTTYIIRVASYGTYYTGFSGVLRVSQATPMASYVSPANAVLEPGNPCDEWADDVNFGCNPRTTPADSRFTPIELCQTYMGHARFRTLPGPDGPPIPDTDSYMFTLDAPDTITVIGQTQFNAVIVVINGDYCGGQYQAYTLGIRATADCAAGEIGCTVQLPAGQFRLGISNDSDARATCGHNDEYWFRVMGSSPCPDSNVCTADLGVQGGGPGQDGLLDNNDFIAFINYFFEADSHADVGVQGGLPGHDGLFDNNDFIAFINSFFNGCP